MEQALSATGAAVQLPSQQTAIDAYNRTLEEKERILALYQKECQNWNNLYYCYRDDCIFVPGKGHAAPISELASYLDIA